MSRNSGSQLVLDLNPNDVTPSVVHQPIRRRVESKCTAARLGQDWSRFMHEVTTPRKGLEEEARLERSRLVHKEVDSKNMADPIVSPLNSPAFARIEAPRRPAAQTDLSKINALEADLDGKKLTKVQLEDRRQRLIALGSQAVSSASQRAAESADEASRTAAKLARYARRRFQERTGRVYTGTTFEDDVFPIRQPTRNELFLIVGVAFAIASAFAWRWQAKLDAKGTRQGLRPFSSMSLPIVLLPMCQIPSDVTPYILFSEYHPVL